MLVEATSKSETTAPESPFLLPLRTTSLINPGFLEQGKDFSIQCKDSGGPVRRDRSVCSPPSRLLAWALSAEASLPAVGLHALAAAGGQSGWLRAWKGQSCSGQLRDPAFSTAPCSFAFLARPHQRPTAWRSLNGVQQQRRACPESLPLPSSKPPSCLPLLAGRRTRGLAGPRRKFSHKVPLCGAGLCETNGRDFKINGKLFLSMERLKCLYFPSWETNLKGSLCCSVFSFTLVCKH